MNFNFKDEFYEDPYTTNAYVAGITTAHARMKLFNECLGPLSERSVYCDTDSIKYTVNNTDKPLEYNDNLGGLKDELDGGYLKNFIATGPISYAHINNKDEITTHIKGFTLNVRNIEKLSFENICAIIDGEMEKISVTNPDHFLRSHKKKSVRLRELTKEFKIDFDKRVVQSNFTTLPYMVIKSIIFYPQSKRIDKKTRMSESEFLSFDENVEFLLESIEIQELTEKFKKYQLSFKPPTEVSHRIKAPVEQHDTQNPITRGWLHLKTDK